RRIRVLIADDHAAVRFGVSRLLADQPDMQVIAEASSAIAAVDQAGRCPDVAVVDYHLGDRSGLWVTDRLRHMHPRPRILIYSAFSDGALAVAAIVAGADGLLSKSSIGEELCVAVRRLASGRQYLPSISSTLIRALGERLHPQQEAIVGMLVHGISPAQIAIQLGLSEQELESERAAILAVLAPAVTRAGPRAPLDYDRPRRKFSAAKGVRSGLVTGR
ncbi:MAG: response regulator, partial [Solirubrobacteraceae bacterium]